MFSEIFDAIQEGEITPKLHFLQIFQVVFKIFLGGLTLRNFILVALYWYVV